MTPDKPIRDNPCVSIVMPAYNVAAFVDEAVETLYSQTWPRIELLVVDDGSTDATPAALARHAPRWQGPGRVLRILRQENAGAAAARNTGLAAAQGDYVGFFDADDRVDPACVARLVAALQAAPEIDIVFPHYREIDEVGGVLQTPAAPAARVFGLRDLLNENVIHSPLIRGEAARAVGGFDPALRACIDYDYYLKIAARRPDSVQLIGDVLADYRRRAGQITADWRRMEAHWTRVTTRLRASQPGLPDRVWRHARGRNALYWATLAYRSQDYAAARRLVAEMWWNAPGFALADRHARIRTLASLVALLPAGLHDRIQTRFNAATGATV